MTQHSLTRRWFFSRAVLATAGGAVAPAAMKVAVSPVMSMEQAREAYPITLHEASRIMVEHFRNDGPLTENAPRFSGKA